METCSIEGCDKPHLARGWCGMHYRRWRVHGDPHEVAFVVGDLERRFLRYLAASRRGDEECWPWAGARNGRGYGCIYVGGRNLGAHRYAYERAHGALPPNRYVLHSCDNPPCVNLAHLRAGTPAENTADKFQRGRHPASRQGSAVHVDQDRVREVRRRVAAGEVQRRVAEAVGLSPSHVCNIVSGKTCAWVPDA